MSELHTPEPNNDEEVLYPCEDICPFKKGLDHRPLEEIGKIVCIPAAKLSEESCAGATVWNDETGTIFCKTTSTVYAQNGSINLRFRDKKARVKNARRHYPALWEKAHAQMLEDEEIKLYDAVTRVEAGEFTSIDLSWSKPGKPYAELSKDERRRYVSASIARYPLDRYKLVEDHRQQGASTEEAIAAILQNPTREMIWEAERELISLVEEGCFIVDSIKRRVAALQAARQSETAEQINDVTDEPAV